MSSCQTLGCHGTTPPTPRCPSCPGKEPWNGSLLRFFFNSHTIKLAMSFHLVLPPSLFLSSHHNLGVVVYEILTRKLPPSRPLQKDYAIAPKCTEPQGTPAGLWALMLRCVSAKSKGKSAKPLLYTSGLNQRIDQPGKKLLLP